MKYLVYIKQSLISLALIMLGTIVITLLSFIGFFDFASLLQILLVVIIFFIGGYISSTKSKNKGYIDGLYFSLITILLIFIINLIFIRDFSFKYLFYYILLIICSIIGGMISNIKRPKN